MKAPMVLGLAAASAVIALTAHALSPPQTEPLAYTGTLEEANAPVTGARDLTLRLWSDPASILPAKLVCTTTALGTTVTGGRFRIVLDGSCVTGVHANADLWVELLVGTTPLPRVHIGAVPYALEAAKAIVSHDGTLTGDSTSALLGVDLTQVQRRVGGTCTTGMFITGVGQDGTVTCDAPPLAGGAAVPPGAVMFFDLAACPTGWSPVPSAQGRYIVGLGAGGTLGQTVGTALSNGENRAVGQHNHAGSTGLDGAHTHTVPRNGGGFSGIGGFTIQTGTAATTTTSTTPDHNHTVTIGNSGSVAGTNAPYLQLLACRKD